MMFKVYVADSYKGCIYEWPTLNRMGSIGFKLTNTDGDEYPLNITYGEMDDGVIVPGNSIGAQILSTSARFSGTGGITNGLFVMDLEFYVNLPKVSQDIDDETYDKWFLYDGISRETTRMFRGSVKGSVSDLYMEHRFEGRYEDVWTPRPNTIERLMTPEGMTWYKIKEYYYKKENDLQWIYDISKSV